MTDRIHALAALTVASTHVATARQRMQTALDAFLLSGKGPAPKDATATLEDLTQAGHQLDDATRFVAEPASRPALAITISPNATSNPPGKLADAELHFLTGPLAGCKLIGFSVWARRVGSPGPGHRAHNVTFPARQYTINGERRSFALLRPTTDQASHDRIREMVLDAFTRYEDPSSQDQPSTRTEYDEQGNFHGSLYQAEHSEPMPAAAQASTTTVEQPITPYGLSPQDLEETPSYGQRLDAPGSPTEQAGQALGQAISRFDF